MLFLSRIYVIFLILLLVPLNMRAEKDEKKNYFELVNPLVDTHRSRWFFFASACRPFGMVSLSPDTDTENSWGSGYLYDSKYIPQPLDYSWCKDESLLLHDESDH